MRRFRYAGMVAVAAAFLAVMSGTAAASTAVLTYDSLGGTPVGINDPIRARSVGDTTLYTTGGSGVKCGSSDWVGTVTSNPTAPGTATVSLTSATFANCVTVNVTGATCVKSITVSGLPYTAWVASTLTVTVSAAAGGAISVTIVLCTLLGNVSCVYAHAGSVVGTYSNVDNTVTFPNVPFDRTSGPSMCPTPVYFTGKYRVTDGTGLHPIFVN